jgi:hypothetical protein
LPDKVNVVTGSGRTISVPAEQADLPEYRPQTPEEADEAARVRAEEEAYGGAGNAVAAGFLGAARMFTGGLSDQYFGAVGGDETREDLAKYKEHQALATGVGEVVGAVVGPGKVAGAAGKAVRGAGTKAAARVAAHGVEGAVDGGLFSLGQTVSEAAIHNEPLTFEHVGANVGVGTALGFGLGAGFGGIIEGAGAVRKRYAGKANPLLHPEGAEAREVGKRFGGEIRKIDDALDDKVWVEAEANVYRDMLRRQRPISAADTIIDNSPERAALVREAAAAEKRAAELEAEAAATRKKTAQEAAKKARQEARQLQRDLSAVGKRAEREVAGYKPPPGSAPTRVEGMTEEMAAVRASDNAVPDTLAQDTTAVRKQGQAAAEAEVPAFDPNATNPGKRAAVAKPKARLRPDDKIGQVPDYDHPVNADRASSQEIAALRAEVKAARSGIVKVLGADLNVHLPALVRKQPGQMIKFAEAVDNYVDGVNKVRKLARMDPVGFEDLVPSLAQGLPEAEKALEGLNVLKDKTKLADVLGIDVGAVPQLKSNVADGLLRVYGVARQSTTEAARKTAVDMSAWEMAKQQLVGGIKAGLLARAVGHTLGGPGLAMMGIATMAGRTIARVGEGAARAVEVSAKVARRPAVLTASKILSEVRFSDKEDTSEPNVAKRRAKELAELAANPGQLDARLADRLAPLRAHNLDLGFAVENQIKQRLAFYQQHAPKSPVSETPLVRSKWQPAPGEVHEWAIRIKSGEDPLSILDDLASGRVHPVAVETVETLWPALYGQMQQEIAEQMVGLREDLPYSKRLQLSLLFKVPVEATADPEFVKTLQDQYAARREMEKEQQPSRPGGAPPAPPATKGQQLEAR